MNSLYTKNRSSVRTINSHAPRARSTTSMSNYFEYEVIQKIGRTKFPVFFVQCSSTQKKYALKAYAMQDQRASNHFINESRMFGLKHPHIITPISAKLKARIKYKEKVIECSYIVMELSPFRDFNELLNERKFCADAKLVRTYFHHLIEGLEYLHSKSIAHLDLKPENLLMGEDYTLKITDFDRSSFPGDKTFNSRGTEDFRAPEVSKGKIEDPFAGDIFSAGVILFVFLTSVMPYSEVRVRPGHEFFKLIAEDEETFWKLHKELNGIDQDEEFKELFSGMVRWNHRDRFKLSDIEASSWYQREVYSDKELSAIMEKRLGKKFNYKF